MITNIDREKLISKIMKDYWLTPDREDAEILCNTILENGSDTFRQNLVEWIEGGPFSDITVYGYNINKILDIWNIKDEIHAILDLSNLEKYGDKYKCIILLRWRS